MTWCSDDVRSSCTTYWCWDLVVTPVARVFCSICLSALELIQQLISILVGPFPISLPLPLPLVETSPFCVTCLLQWTRDNLWYVTGSPKALLKFIFKVTTNYTQHAAERIGRTSAAEISTLYDVANLKRYWQGIGMNKWSRDFHPMETIYSSLKHRYNWFNCTC